MKSIVSLEVMTDFVRAVEVAKPLSGKPTLLRYAEVPVAPGVVGDAEVIDAEVAADALKELWKIGDFSTKVVNLAVSSRRIMVRDYDAPYIDLAKIKETLTFEAADLLPSQMENSVLDFYPVEKVDNNGKFVARGLLVATAAEPLETIVTTLTLAGLTVEFVDLTPFGLVRAARTLLPMDEEYFLVKINPFSSEVIAVRDGAPRMVRVIPNGINVRGGASGKHRGVADQGQSLAVEGAGSSITPVDSFIGALRSTMNYYEDRGGSVSKVYVTGEGSLSKELEDKLFPALGLPLRTMGMEDFIGAPAKQSERDPLVEAALVGVAASAMRGVK